MNTSPEKIPDLVDQLEPFTAYAGQVMLVGADWTHQNGHTAKFNFMASDLDCNPMADFTVRKQRKSGTRFHMILIEIQDDETPVNQDQREKVEVATGEGETGKQGRVKAAGIIARADLFHQYLMSLSIIKERHSTKFRIDIAAEYIRKECEIKSRTELKDDAVWSRYINKIQRPFDDWFSCGGGHGP